MSEIMRAVICRGWGEADSLRLEEVPVPAVCADEILIRVAATAVNYADSIMIAGRYQTKPAFPFSPGLECAGTVERCGSAVTGFAPGDRVMAILPHGGFAQFVTTKAADAWVMPDGMSFAEGAVFPVAYMSSDVALRWQGRPEAGEWLLVLGAAGGVGLTAVEIGKAMGLTVIAAASSAERLAVAADRGADHLIDYSTEDLKDRVMALTGGRGVDLCYDPVGGDLFDRALSSLAWGGRLLVVGFVGGIPQIPANRLLVKNRSALGCSLRHYRFHEPAKLRASMEALLAWYAQGRLRPLITAEYPLDRTAEAMAALTRRAAFGKIVVVP